MMTVDVIITNDSGRGAVTLSGMNGEFITASRTKIAPARRTILYALLSIPRGPRPLAPFRFPSAGRPKRTVSTKADGRDAARPVFR